MDGKDSPALVTTRLFADYLACPMKCFPRSKGESVADNPFSVWIINGSNPTGKGAEVKRFSGSKITLDRLVRAQNLEAQLATIQRVKGFHPTIPIYFVPANKLSRSDRLVAAFNALVLSKVESKQIDSAKTIHGDECSSVSVNIKKFSREVGIIIHKIIDLLSSSSPPNLVLNPTNCVALFSLVEVPRIPFESLDHLEMTTVIG